MARVKRQAWLGAAVLMAGLSVTASHAAVKPNGLFVDNAVLQRGIPIPVWGTASAGEKVTVQLGSQKASTTAQDGRWMVRLKAMKAGGPYTMTISGENTLEMKNVMVGEVWVCSGQSNMEFPLSMAANAQEAAASAQDPMLRLYTVPKAVTDTPLTDVNAQWMACTPQCAGGFSAVGYFFGRALRKSLNVPVGLIHTSWGGSFAEAWTSPKVLAANPGLEGIPKEIKGQGPHVPSGLYNGMLAPIIPYGIRGAIWYQGESNAGRAYTYRTLFPTMIKNWRDDWGQGDFPFLFVQLAPFEYEPASTDPKESAWAELREAQLLTSLNTPNTGMAVITDVGDAADIHPRRKEQVGDRLALIARAKVYRDKIEYSGPQYKSMAVDGNRAILSFNHVGGGLVAADGKLKGFAIAGDDHKFVWADASIQGDKVIVSSPSVAHPVAVRYGWANCPDVNIFNKKGIPASPFRTDDFQILTGPQAK